MATFVETAKQALQDSFAGLAGELGSGGLERLTARSLTPLSLGFAAGDVLLMTHDVAVGLALLELEVRQVQLNVERAQAMDRHEQELAHLERTQTAETNDLRERQAEQIERLAGHAEELKAAEHQRALETQELNARHEREREERQAKQQAELRELQQRQEEAIRQQQRALQTKLVYGQSPSL